MKKQSVFNILPANICFQQNIIDQFAVYVIRFSKIYLFHKKIQKEFVLHFPD